ncbi:MAG: thioesterase [Rickettsiales bacterium]|nr:thioesterase [Rickettsiales bacterium]
MVLGIGHHGAIMTATGPRRSRPTLADDLAPVRLEIDVAWGEMDSFQHVNNIIYLRWFESARIEYFRQTGFIEHMQATQVGPILAESRCRYRAPVTFPDRVTVTASARQVSEDRFVMDYRLYSQQQGFLVAEGDGTVVCYDFAAGRKAPLPAEVLRAMQELEGRGDLATAAE